MDPTCKVHTEMLRAANLDELDIPTNHDGRPMRRTAYAIPPEQFSDEQDSDSEQEGPYEKLSKKYQKEREDSVDDNNIPQKLIKPWNSNKMRILERRNLRVL